MQVNAAKRRCKTEFSAATDDAGNDPGLQHTLSRNERLTESIPGAER
jgi:hypothetical protein